MHEAYKENVCENECLEPILACDFFSEKRSGWAGKTEEVCDGGKTDGAHVFLQCENAEKK